MYDMAQSDRLRKEYERTHNITYDWVIRIRPDLFIPAPLSIDLQVLEKEVLPSINSLFVDF